MAVRPHRPRNPALARNCIELIWKHTVCMFPDSRQNNKLPQFLLGARHARQPWASCARRSRAACFGIGRSRELGISRETLSQYIRTGHATGYRVGVITQPLAVMIVAFSHLCVSGQPCGRDRQKEALPFHVPNIEQAEGPLSFTASVPLCQTTTEHQRQRAGKGYR